MEDTVNVALAQRDFTFRCDGDLLPLMAGAEAVELLLYELVANQVFAGGRTCCVRRCSRRLRLVSDKSP